MPFTWVFPPGTHFTAESTDAMRITFLAEGPNLMIQPGFEPSISVSRNQHLNHIANMLKNVGVRMHHCVTSLVMDKSAVNALTNYTVPFKSSSKLEMTIDVVDIVMSPQGA